MKSKMGRVVESQEEVVEELVKHWRSWGEGKRVKVLWKKTEWRAVKYNQTYVKW